MVSPSPTLINVTGLATVGVGSGVGAGADCLDAGVMSKGIGLLLDELGGAGRL